MRCRRCGVDGDALEDKIDELAAQVTRFQNIAMAADKEAERLRAEVQGMRERTGEAAGKSTGEGNAKT